MKDYKDNATLELPGFDAPASVLPECKAAQTKIPRSRIQKQQQMDLLAPLGPTDLSGLPVWEQDEGKDLSGLPVWR